MQIDEIATEKLAAIEKRGTLRSLRQINSIGAKRENGADGSESARRQPALEAARQGPRVEINGRQVLLFAGSNYLDLSRHPEVVEAAAEAVATWGCAAGGSRLISGNLDLHEELEEELARFSGREAALCFNSGYAANLGIIPALVGPDDVLISDTLNHASIIDGARLSGAKVEVAAHGDLESLERALCRAREHGGRRLLVVDGVFSMDGDVPPLRETIALARSHDAIVVLDDAHGTATLGPQGRGAAAHCGIDAGISDGVGVGLVDGLVDESGDDKVHGVRDACASRGLGVDPFEAGVDIYLGNLAKALGSFGAFAAGSRLMRELLINVSRSFIFTCALPPAQLGAARAALRISLAEPWRRWALQANASRLRERLHTAGISTEPSTTHIVPVIIGENAATMEICEALLREGFYVQGIRHPSVPRDSARLRITPMATHREEEIDALSDAVIGQMQRRGLVDRLVDRGDGDGDGEATDPSRPRATPLDRGIRG